MVATKLSHASTKGQTPLKPEERGTFMMVLAGRWWDFLLSAYGFGSGSALADIAPSGSGDE